MRNYFKHHVFFCLNRREDGSACCTDHDAEGMFDYAKSRIKKLGLNGPGKVRVNRAGCFDRCGEGPLLVIYPEAVWYTFIDQDDIDEIIESHLQNGRVVERELLKDPAGRDFFKRFLEKEYSSENLRFYELCNELRSTTNKEVAHKVDEIYK